MGEFHAMLVEGVPGIGKSTLVDALIRRHVDSSDPRRIRSLLHLSQTHTYGPLAPAEDRGLLTVTENLELLDRIARTLEWLNADLRHSDKPCFVLIDSLHLTHCLRPGIVTWEDAAPFDRRLAEIGCKLLLLTGAPETIRSRTIHARADSQFLTQYAKKFGQTLEMIHAHFVGEQAQFIDMFGRSALEKRVFENDGSLDTIVEDAYRFWTAEPGASRVRFNTQNA